MLLSSPSHQQPAIQISAHSSSSTSATLAQQQLAALLKEAQQYEAKSDYENQIKAVFYYQVALAFCEKQLKELAEAADKEPSSVAISVTATSSPRDFRAFYTQEKERIIDALAQLEFAYPEKALDLPSKTSLSSGISSASESKEPLKPVPALEIIKQRLKDNPHKEALNRIRIKAKNFLEDYKKPSSAASSEEGKVEFKPKSMQAIYRELTADMKQLVRQMITECIEEYGSILGYPPCDYAFFGLGSMARDEMTPYSDLEFGILIAEDDPDGVNKTYFQNITKLLHLKVINLGETTPRIMGEKLPIMKIPTGLKVIHEEIPNPVPNGLSFDGIGAGGCKNPFGRKDKFELIGTPADLADYQDPKHYEKDAKLADERFLPSSLAQATLIAGGVAGRPLAVKAEGIEEASGRELLENYQVCVKVYLSKTIQQLWGKPIKLQLRRARALELLLSDIERFQPKMGKVEPTGRSYSVKHDLYRLPNMVLDQLALFYGLADGNSWACVEELSKASGGRPALFTPEARKHLLQTIDQVNEYRLAAYLELGEQCEEAEAVEIATASRTVGSLQIFASDDKRHPVFLMPAEAVRQIYYCLLPFWQAARCFRDRLGDAKAFQEVFPALYSDSPLVQGQITALLQGYGQALKVFEPLLAEKEEAKIEKTDLKIVPKEVTLQQSLAYQAAGRAYQEVIHYEKAELHLRAAIRGFEAYGSSYAVELSECYLDLALVLRAQSSTRIPESKECVKKAQALVQASYGNAHPYAIRCEQVNLYIQQSDHSPYRIQNAQLRECWPLALPRNNEALFVGRTTQLTTLSRQFNPLFAGQRVVLSAVAGLGGIGKTTLAIHYLHHAEHPYRLRLWFNAKDAIQLQTDYRELARQFELIPIEEKTSAEDINLAVIRFLEKHRDWLAIYDNAGEYRELEKLIPKQGGHVIITTRRSEWGRPEVGLKVDIDVFTEEESVVYLKKATGLGTADDMAAMKRLAERLGYLPLALSQAAAYIHQQKISVTEYLALYEKYTAALLADNTLPVTSEGKTVSTTWRISLEAIAREEVEAKEEPLSLALLQAMSYLDSANIPRSVLLRWLTATQLVQAIPVEIALNKALGHLESYSLVQLSRETRAVNVHCLVQETTRQLSLKTNLTLARPSSSDGKLIHTGQVSILDAIAMVALGEFAQALPPLEAESNEKRLLPHLYALKNHADSWPLRPLVLANVLFDIGLVLLRQSTAPHQAKTYFERALSLFKMSGMGAESVQVAEVFGNLAVVYGDLGDAKNQKALSEQVLVILEKRYGVEHWQVAGALVNLAVAHGDLGDARSQKALLERALVILEKHYGREHWRVAVTLVSLANAYGDLGGVREKKALLERALAIQEQYYGREHWQVAITLANLAVAHGDLGDVREKKALLERALVIEEKHYGREHWQVASTLGNLANAHGALGDTVNQKLLLERTLGIQEKHYGREHWQVARTLGNLGNAYGALGDAMSQKALLEDALGIEEKHYGAEHWQVASTLVNLANAYYALGDARNQKALLERALAIEEKHYGRGHWQVGMTLLKLASAYIKMNKVILSFAHAERAHNIFCASYSDLNHPYTQQAEALVNRLKEMAPVFNVATPTALELLHRQDETGARQYFKDQKIDFDDEKVHLILSQIYAEKRQPLPCILHYQQVLQLAQVAKRSERKLAGHYHNLACYYHCYAQQQRANAKEVEEKRSLEQADSYFQQGIKLSGHPGIRTEYGQFLLLQGRFSEAIEQLRGALKMASGEFKEDGLGYGKMERPTLETNLQIELDFWHELSVPAVLLAHYLSVITEVKQNNQAAAQHALEVFKEFGKDSKEALVHSLLGHAQCVVSDYSSALKSYQHALILKADYTVAQQQIKICQRALGIVVEEVSAVTDTDSTGHVVEAERESKLEASPGRISPPTTDNYLGTTLSLSSAILSQVSSSSSSSILKEAKTTQGMTSLMTPSLTFFPSASSAVIAKPASTQEPSPNTTLTNRETGSETVEDEDENLQLAIAISMSLSK